MLSWDEFNDTIFQGVPSMNAAMMEKYLHCRPSQLGLQELSPGAKNFFPWMSEIMGLRKEKNFFETRMTDTKLAVRCSGNHTSKVIK